MKPLTFTLILIFIGVQHYWSQQVLSEICHTNLSVLADESGDFEDWIEIYNPTSELIVLTGGYLSDDFEELNKWQIPALSLEPGDRKIIWASGKNRFPLISHYEVPAFPWDEYAYFVPQEEVDENWHDVSFDEGWEIGPGGFGYGDGDDNTELDQCISVLLRREFQISDPNSVVEAFLFMDYDDSFVAYLNGVEIARSNIGNPGEFVAWDQPANSEREAQSYQGGEYESFILDTALVAQSLVAGTNVFSIRVHNNFAFSSDLSALPLLILGKSNGLVESPLAPAEWNLANVSEYHTNFKLSTGETLFFSDSNLNVVESVLIAPMDVDQSLAMVNGSWCFSIDPTPLNANNTVCSTGVEPKPLVSVQAGLYNTTQLVTLIPQSSTSVIHYTLDGSIPNEEDEIYLEPIPIENTTVLSVKAFSNAGLLPSPVEKNTYLINEFGIGTKVMSISTNFENLWDEEIGIYVLGLPDYDPWYPFFGSNFWEDWERQSYIEIFETNEFQKEAQIGLSIHGGWSRAQDQKSFRVRFRDEYGTDELEYPLIEDKPDITRFKNFNLRNGGNDYWDGRSRDAFMQRVMKDTKNDYMAASQTAVFLNGEYWGHYEIREVLDENWCESNHGVDADSVSLITDTYFGFDVKEGSAESFEIMYNVIINGDAAADDFFEIASEHLDLENFTDYIATETYYANCDWSCGYKNNTKFWHYDNPSGKWRYMLMDLDFGLGFYGTDPNDEFLWRAVDDDFAMDNICEKLLQNMEFRNYFINRYADLINSVWQQENMEAKGNEIRSQVEPYIERHHQRWGGNYDQWYNTMENSLNWNELRIPGARNMIQNFFQLPNQVNITLDVFPAGAGRIHISTIEPKESEYPWTGVYYNGVPVRITAIANPGYEFEYFLPNGIFDENMPVRSFLLNIPSDEVFTAVFIGSNENASPQVSEFMYHPDFSKNSGDWIELYNPHSFSLDVSSWKIQNENWYNQFVIPVNTVIQPGERLVIASNLDVFEVAYPEVNDVVGSLSFNLGNFDDKIILIDRENQARSELEYSHFAPWPMGTDGYGRSVERISNASNEADPNSWFEGCIYGSPGEPYFECDSTLLLTEINYRSSSLADAGEWFEIKNTSSNAIDLGGFVIRDKSDQSEWLIPGGTIIEPDSFLVFSGNMENFQTRFPSITNTVGEFDFNLANNDDVIRFYTPQGELMVSVHYSSLNPWPAEANGQGKTLELLSASGSMCSAENWFAGCLEGSPGEPYDPSCGIVNVTETETLTEWTFGPNPALNEIWVITNEALSTMEIFNTNGQLVRYERLARGMQNVDISELSQGVYLLVIGTENAKSSQRLVVR